MKPIVSGVLQCPHLGMTGGIILKRRFTKSVLTHARGPFKLYRYKKKLAELDLLSKSMQGLEQRVFCFSIVIIYGPTGS